LLVIYSVSQEKRHSRFSLGKVDGISVAPLLTHSVTGLW